MEAAKAAAKNILYRDGHHDTQVKETVAPAVTHEHVTRTQEEQVRKVVDREVHQHHQHMTVQPIAAEEVLPTQEVHQQAAGTLREFHHGNDENVKQRVANEAAQFKDTRTVGDVERSRSEAAVLGGEHIHHHIHETIQPVIEKEVVQPTKVHTTIPVKEVHYNETKHHTATTLPPVTMEQFQAQGGVLGGHETRIDGFAGEPHSTHGILGGHGAAGNTTRTVDAQGQGASLGSAGVGAGAAGLAAKQAMASHNGRTRGERRGSASSSSSDGGNNTSGTQGVGKTNPITGALSGRGSTSGRDAGSPGSNAGELVSGTTTNQPSTSGMSDMGPNMSSGTTNVDRHEKKSLVEKIRNVIK